MEKRSNVQKKHALIEEKLSTMKDKYTNLVRTNSKKIFLYCLDSFFFQYKILSKELDHYKQINAMVYNRMYGDYYKLFNIIITQCREGDIRLKDVEEMENIPVYKDTESKTEYKLDDLLKLHINILAILKQLKELYEGRNVKIQSQDDYIYVGFSITSFIETLSYENRLLNEQIMLYTNYLIFYHSSQNGYLDKITDKLNAFSDNINHEILINHKSSNKLIYNCVSETVFDDVSTNTLSVNVPVVLEFKQNEQDGDEKCDVQCINVGETEDDNFAESEEENIEKTIEENDDKIIEENIEKTIEENDDKNNVIV
jgi:hypothetical protein